MNEQEFKQVDVKQDISKAVSSLFGSIRPLAVLGTKGILTINDKTRSVITCAREEIEDLVAEAKFEKMKDDLDTDIFGSETTE